MATGLPGLPGANNCDCIHSSRHGEIQWSRPEGFSGGVSVPGTVEPIAAIIKGPPIIDGVSDSCCCRLLIAILNLPHSPSPPIEPESYL
jgi:hypothetical protein